jgi:SulP family sulfate permease
VFAVNYARLDAIRASGTGTSFVSTVLRPPAHLRLLTDHGDALQVIRLQGYLFFGSAHRVLERIAGRLALPCETPLRFLVIDLEWVDGADSSTMFSLMHLVERADRQGVRVLFSALPDTVAASLQSAGLACGPGPGRRVFSDLDHALEHAEDAFLASGRDWSEIEERTPAPPVAAIVNMIHAYGERVVWRAGDHAIREGEQSAEMYFVESGRLTVQFELADGSHVRLRTAMPGTVIGEVAGYLGLPRSASVVADQDSSAFRLTDDALARMRVENPTLAVSFHEFMARTTAERLAHNTRFLDTRRV